MLILSLKQNNYTESQLSPHQGSMCVCVCVTQLHIIHGMYGSEHIFKCWLLPSAMFKIRVSLLLFTAVVLGELACEVL